MQINPVRSDAVVLDDDEIHLEILAAALQRYDFGKIHRAASGVEGIDIIAEHRERIRLVVTDLCMPDVDGIEVQHELSRHVPDAPLLIVSGTHPDLINAAQVLAENAGLRVLGVLKKPLNLNTLHRILDAELADLVLVSDGSALS